MKLEDFIEALYKSGWDSPDDAKHTKITELHKKLFPVISALEYEIEDLRVDLRYLGG